MLGAAPVAVMAADISARPSNISRVDDLSGLGMCVHLKHFKQTPEEIARLKDAGMKYVRVDITWSATEKVKGEYNWDYYDKMLGPIVDAGLRPILMLGYSNSLYINNEGKHVPPRTPEEITAFATWAAAATEHFKPLNPIMEIWNEADIPQFWNPKPKVEEFLAMAGPACEAMRTAVPEATILSSGIGNVPVETNPDSQVFMRQMMADKGFMNCIDAVSIHPYRTSGPETLLKVLPFLNSMAEDSAAMGGAVRRPYVVTELGYSSFLPKDKPRIDDARKAAYTVRMPVVGILADFPLMMLYNWRDYGNNMLDKEDRFGLLDFDNEDKPAVTGLKVLHATIGDMQLERRIETPDEDVFVVVFKDKDGDRKLMAWHAIDKAVLSFDSVEPVSGVTMQGKAVTYKPKKGVVTVPLTGNPVYLSMGTGELPALTVK